MSERERDELGRFVAQDAVDPEVTEDEPPPQEAPDDGADEARRELEAEARKWGWKPREEWRTRTPDRTPEDEGWNPADKFLSSPGTQVKILRHEQKQWETERQTLKQSLAGIERASQEAVRRAREQERAEWEGKVLAAQQAQREAVEAADTDKWVKARQQEDQLRRYAPQEPASPPPSVTPEMADYRAKNAWTRDPDAISYGLALVENQPHILAIKDPIRQLKAVEMQIRPVFPHLFEPETPPPPRSTHSKVDGGGLAGSRRGTALSDLPAEAQAAFNMFKKEGVPITEAEFVKDYLGQ